MSYTRVVIIGGGFGGLNAAKSLGNSNLDVLLVDKTNHHLFQPLLYQVASAALSPADIATPIREILKPFSNETVVMGHVVKIEKEKKQIQLANGDTISYDFLIVAIGAHHSYFGHDEWQANAPGLKTLVDALKIRERILLSFEKAERSDSISEARKYLNFVIIGAGPTGVELAGAIAEIAHETMLKNFRRIDPTKTKVFLVEAAPHILPQYPEKLANKAKSFLEKFKVKVLDGKAVVDVTSEGVQVGDQFIETKNVIWAAGNKAPELLKTLDVPLDKQCRVIVEEDLSIPNHPEVFVIGDAAKAQDKKGNPLPGLAPVAIQQGRYVANIIKKNISKSQRKPFRYFDKGTVATIGKTKAVGMFGKFKFSGFFAWIGWCFIHIAYLITFRSRIIVLIQWFFAYLSGQRGARLINKPLDPELPKQPD
ncbi:MAG: NAD(P)/FAD-dependent oxidoreductase [Chlamydiota bacterium]|jgi:NADH dehydrogenase